MADVPRIFSCGLDNKDVLMILEQGLSVLPKSTLKRLFKTFKPMGGIRIPNPERDAPQKVARFLAGRESMASLAISMAGLQQAIAYGPWAETRARLLPNLLPEDFQDLGHPESIPDDSMDLLSPEKLPLVTADLEALHGKQLEPEERRVLLALELILGNLTDPIRLLIPEELDNAMPVADGVEATEGGPESADLEASDQVVDPEGENPTLPSNDFTTLDKLLFRASVDSVAGVEGSLPPEEMADLVEELINLNATRTRSYFHRGYLQALNGTSFEQMGHEQNQERRAWEWAGRIIGLVRFDRKSDILEEFDANPHIARQMAAGEHEDAAAGAMPRVVSALLDADRFQDACALLKPELVGLHPDKYLPDLIYKGRNLVRLRRVEQAKLVIGKARELLAVDGIGQGCPPHLRYECERRWGQVLRAQGAYREARALFERLLEQGGPIAELRTDMALCAGKARWLDDLLLPGRNSEHGALLHQIEPGMADARLALEAGGPASGAAYLLGLEALLHRNSESQSLAYLEQAYEMALARDEVYAESLFFPQLCLALSVAILLAMDESRFDTAHGLLHRALDEGRISKLPLDFFKRAIHVVRASSHPACLEILQDFEQRCPDILDEHLRDPDFLEASPSILKLLQRRACSELRTPQSRWNDLSALLKASIRASKLDIADTCLDAMEGLALKHERLTDAYLEVLTNMDLAGACLEDMDRLEARRLLYKTRGKPHDEARVLAEMARHAFGNSKVRLGSECLNLALALGLPAADLAVERQWAKDLNEGVTQRQPTRNSSLASVAILMVGGNETQARYDDQIRTYFRKSDPTLTIEFLHPAWSSNWNSDLEDVRRRLPRFHGIVIMRFNRTLFGRHLRRLASGLEKPWFPCTGHGRDSLVRAIEEAAEVARNLRG